MEIITPTDYFLFPLYLLIFYFFARKIAKKQETPALRKYLMIAFALRMLGSFAYSMIMQYYYGYGDSFTYFSGGSFYFNQILKDPSNLKYFFTSTSVTNAWYENTVFEPSPYFTIPANNIVMKISGLIGFLSFNKFLITSLFFGYFSFIGQWKLFKMFDDINNHKHQRLLAWAVLFTPSIWFWGSGLLKDAICMGAMGIVLNFLYFWRVHKQWSFFKFIYCVFLVYLVTVIKSYIAIIMAMGILIIILWYLLKLIKAYFLRVTVTLMVVGAAFLALANSNTAEMIEKYTQDAVTVIQTFQNSYQTVEEDSKGTFSIGAISTSTSGLILQSPSVIWGCLFRPYLWESKKVIMLFTALESTILLLITIFLFIRTGIFGFFKLTFNNPYLLFCFSITILFSLIIGFTTFNYGTMIRYKIIFLPFLYFLIANIYTTTAENKKLNLKT
jgi:hypothetical protein